MLFLIYTLFCYYCSTKCHQINLLVNAGIGSLIDLIIRAMVGTRQCPCQDTCMGFSCFGSFRIQWVHGDLTEPITTGITGTNFSRNCCTISFEYDWTCIKFLAIVPQAMCLVRCRRHEWSWSTVDGFRVRKLIASCRCIIVGEWMLCSFRDSHFASTKEIGMIVATMIMIWTIADLAYDGDYFRVPKSISSGGIHRFQWHSTSLKLARERLPETMNSKERTLAYS